MLISSYVEISQLKFKVQHTPTLSNKVLSIMIIYIAPPVYMELYREYNTGQIPASKSLQANIIIDIRGDYQSPLENTQNHKRKKTSQLS